MRETPRLGDYALEEELGRGSAGVVHRGRAVTGGLVAIKTFDPALARDPVVRARIDRESRVARELVNPHLVQILEQGETDGTPYLVLEYLPGGSLARRLANGPLPLAQLLDVVAHVASGLDTLHRGGIVHRDVKPSNIMFREDGSAVLTDLGLAKDLAAAAATAPGRVLGTLDYLAPELIRGAPATPASDLYALGCVAFECLAGRPPFGDRSLFGVGRAHLEEAPSDPPASPELSRALLHALEKDPSARPPTATMYSHLLRAAARS